MSDKKEQREPRRLVSVTLREPASFGGHAALGGSGIRFDCIVPARLDAVGDWVSADKERPDGLGLVRRTGPSSAPRVERYYVPLANVASMQYGD